MNGNEYKDVFLNEAREYLSSLNNALVVLEKDPTQIEPIREIFRVAHTMKSMSATMGYEPMSRLTHQMESVMEPIRSGSGFLSSRLVDSLFSCLDQLENWIKTLETQDEIKEGDLEKKLNMLKENAGEKVPGPVSTPAGAVSPDEIFPFQISDSEEEVLSQARMSGFFVYEINVVLDPECVFKEARAFLVLRTVNELGEIVKSSISPKDLEKGQFDRRFCLIVVSEKSKESIKEAILGISEIQHVRVENFQQGIKETVDPLPNNEVQFPSTVEQSGSALTEEKTYILSTVRVHTSKLDKLMALVQELMISKSRFEQVIRTNAIKELVEPLSRLNFITDELQDEIMKVRLIPVKQIFERFPRMVRDLAKTLDKKINLEIEGAEVELDRTVIDEISEPLVHLLRNAVDHGIEHSDERVRERKEAFGTIRLQAKRDRSYVIISVSDDGRGIDPEKIRQTSVAKGLISAEDALKLTDEEALRLIGLPGFSTVEKPTEISGRGVGVEVVKTRVEAMGGSFRILSRKGQGTTMILRFPLTLAIIKVLLVKCDEETFAIPVVNVVETIDLIPAEIKVVQQQETFVLRDEVIPLYQLHDLLELEGTLERINLNDYESLIIAEVGDSRIGIKVDQILSQQEVAIKSLDKALKGIRGFSGATILGNGEIALILDINGLVEDLKDRRIRADSFYPRKGIHHVTQSR